jgi:hypothetical protein
MLQRKKLDVDVILDVLTKTLEAYPTSSFIASLLHQYQERGGLSKKQLEGMLHKASNVSTILPAKIATVQAIILKKKSKEKSEIPLPITMPTKDESSGILIENILAKYPNHKRILFLKSKYNSNDVFTNIEKEEVLKFHKLLVK